MDEPKQTKTEALFTQAKAYFDHSEELLASWIAYRRMFTNAFDHLEETLEPRAEQTFEWTVFFGSNVVQSEARMLRHAKRYRRKANRLIKKLSRIEGTLFDSDIFKSIE